MEDKCIYCGETVPEGMPMCWRCAKNLHLGMKYCWSCATLSDCVMKQKKKQLKSMGRERKMTFEEAIIILKKLDTNCGSCTLQANCTYQKDERCLLKECYEKIIKTGELLAGLNFLR